MTKAILPSKLKTIRQKYRLAFDGGRRSGLLLFFELCKQIWGGCPAITFQCGTRMKKFKPKLPKDSKLVTCAQEELKINTQILERMEVTEKC